MCSPKRDLDAEFCIKAQLRMSIGGSVDLAGLVLWSNLDRRLRGRSREHPNTPGVTNYLESRPNRCIVSGDTISRSGSLLASLIRPELVPNGTKTDVKDRIQLMRLVAEGMLGSHLPRQTRAVS